MPEITISEDQRDYLDTLRERLADDHVGEYGHVRSRDALQFLIDRYESDDPGGTAAADASSDADATGEDDGTEADDGSGASRVQSMMNLLDDHADKWSETDAEEGKYVVTLPDGDTEVVRTQDDVRAVLFEHYR